MSEGGGRIKGHQDGLLVEEHVVHAVLLPRLRQRCQKRFL